MLFSKFRQLEPKEVNVSPSESHALAKTTEKNIAELLRILLTKASQSTPSTFGNRTSSNSAITYNRLDGWPRHHSKESANQRAQRLSKDAGGAGPACAAALRKRTTWNFSGRSCCASGGPDWPVGCTLTALALAECACTDALTLDIAIQKEAKASWFFERNLFALAALPQNAASAPQANENVSPTYLSPSVMIVSPFSARVGPG